MLHSLTLRRLHAEVLADNNRLNLVTKIAETFEEIIASAKGQIKAIITTAEVRACLSSQ